MGRIVIAPDAFKGTLSAAEAAQAMADGCRRAGLHDCLLLPLADGGEGTLAVLAGQLPATEWHACSVGSWLSCRLDGRLTAIVESARAIGFSLPSMSALPVTARGSAPLAEMVCDALGSGVEQLIVTLGGSATVDAGLGLLQSLGGVVRERRSGRRLAMDLAALLAARAPLDVDLSGLDRRLADCPLTVLVDVDAPLTGHAGATFCYGPQKGLDRRQLPQTEAAVKAFAEGWQQAAARHCQDLPGAGAAGGLGFALAMLGGRLTPGADWLIERLGLALWLGEGDWLLTGEGRSDRQTMAAKLPWQAAAVAVRQGARPILVSGVIEASARPQLATRFHTMIEAPGGADDAAERLAAAVARELAEQTGTAAPEGRH